MIIIPETPITEASFQKWKSHRIDVTEDDGIEYYYYTIPLMDFDPDAVEDIEDIPSLYSSEGGEFLDDKDMPIFTVRIFDEDLPELTTEEEVEILYKIITKKDLLINN